MRRWVVISFLTAILLFGLPLWNITTSIHRASLDYATMNHYDTSLSELIDVEIPIYINSAGSILPDVVKATQLVIDNKLATHGVPKGWRLVVHSLQDELKTLGKKDTETASSLDAIASEFAARGKKGDLEKAQLLRSAYLVHLVPGESFEHERANISKYQREMVIQYTKESVMVADLPELAAVEIINVFGEEIDQFIELYKSKSDKTAQPGNVNNLAASHFTHYHLTFSLFVQGGDPVGWDISSALKNHFSPLERQLSQKVANFSIDSQVQFYSTLTKLPKEVVISEEVSHVTRIVKVPIGPKTEIDENGDTVVISGEVDQEVVDKVIEKPEEKQFVFTEDDLSTFVNFAEWSLSSIHSYPTLNFILYVPSKEYTPLIVQGSNTNSFIIPQWGGVSIYNDPNILTRSLEKGSLYLYESDLAPILEIFTSQLFSLLGAPSHPAESPIYRLDSLSRLFTLRSLYHAASSLGSLSRLSESLPTISIPDSVALHVDSSLAAIRDALNALKTQRWSQAIIPSAKAMENAHDAFFEKMMVQQMYFPDEHKVAVYLPLLGPIVVVTLMGFLRTVKDLRALRKRLAEKNKVGK